MSSSRKIIGILLLLPTPLVLLGIIWCSGLTRAMTQPSKLTHIATNVLEKVPGFADHTLSLAGTSNKLKNKRARAWLKAIRAAGVKPSTFLRETKMLAWARQESANVIGALERLMDGEPVSREIAMDTRGLKTALGMPKVNHTLKQILSRLPRCTFRQLQAWQQLQLHTKRRKQIPPACHPGSMVLPSILRSKHLAIFMMPASVTLLPAVRKGQLSELWLGLVSHIPWLLFLIPALLIALGAGVGGHGLKGFFQWSGAATLLGGLLALPTPFLLKDVLLKAYLLEPWRANIQKDLPISPEIIHLWLFDHVLPLFRELSGPLFSSVETVGLIVCIAGIGLLGLGATVKAKES